jgi:hypothetical protein
MESAVTHILPLTLVRRKRLLPVPGRVLVSEGQKVSTTDIVADARQPGQHYLVDVRRLLGLPRADQAEKLISHLPGDRVEKDEILAQTGGVFAQSVHAPATGVIVTISSGRILIEADSSPIQIRAGLSGSVREVIPERGVVVETSGALVQGRLGNNQVNLGMMVVTAHSPEDELTSARLDVSMRGAVLVGGHCSQLEVLKAAEELTLRGLILSSVTADLIPVILQANYPIIVVEGIGKIPFCSEAYQILITNEKRDTCVNASAFQPLTGARPEVIVPLPGIGNLPNDAIEIAPGQTVRILSAPYASQSGILVQVRPGKTRLKNGIHTLAADVRLANNEVVTVPLANLDVLE